MVLVGIGLIVFGDDIEDGAGVFLIGAAVLVALLNVFMQIGNRSDADRDREEAARDHFERTVAGPTSARRRYVLTVIPLARRGSRSARDGSGPRASRTAACRPPRGPGRS